MAARKLLTALALLALFLTVTARGTAWATAGDLDPAFGSGGRVRTVRFGSVLPAVAPLEGRGLLVLFEAGVQPGHSTVARLGERTELRAHRPHVARYLIAAQQVLQPDPLQVLLIPAAGLALVA